ncbi:hypothetical protein BDV96DRAFT_567255 [Lophiotrema nucula]|uniref:Uncharacterized protein n=1 Tax=Lophiotrema nucula TaxID=690887 RepID=A0A6A5ZJD9_9PLEO|nr:hypothetical protein BDV96DRAFT_567255 [Lophiotrema nucula]
MKQPVRSKPPRIPPNPRQISRPKRPCSGRLTSFRDNPFSHSSTCRRVNCFDLGCFLGG